MVPGHIAGVWEMHHRFGSIEFGELLSPAIEYAMKGFRAGPSFCRSTAAAFSELSKGAKSIFAPGGVPPDPGQLIRQENLGGVLKEIAESGPDAFYSDLPAEEISELLTRLGVQTSLADFKQFRPEWVTPLSFDYHGIRVHEVPPNSMGATCLLILKQVSFVHLANFGPLSKERIVKTMEAVPPAYARRDRLLGDPKFSSFDFKAFIEDHTRPGLVESRVNPGDTTAFSVADSEGNLVSGIQSLFNQYGSRIFVPGCGIVLNNRGAGFRTSGPNKVEPRKRPLSTLTTMILERGGHPFLSIGTSGGDYRPLQHTLFVTNAADYKMDAEQIVNHPRFLWEGGKSLLVEKGYELPRRTPFNILSASKFGQTGVCHAIGVSKDGLTAVCDPRGEGIPSGY
jgi:gamma-glutamyltranspeptidase/glutathione hydrolase